MNRSKIKPYDEALWAWFLSKAVIRTVYGVDRKLNETFHKHLRICGIAVDISEPPTIGTISEFAGTDNGNDELEGIVSGGWSCECGGWGDGGRLYSLAIEGSVELSRIIYEVIQTGLGNHLLESVTEPEPSRGLTHGSNTRPG